MTWPSLNPARLWCVSTFFVVSALLLSPPAHGQTTILVPGNYPTIQSAINAANNGDAIVVAPGTYVENINFNGKAIMLTSSGGAAITVIDGNASGSVVTFNHGEPLATKLNGFTIRNGYQDGGDGAGILIVAASPTITQNVITQNRAAGGNGIYVNGGAPLISNNTIAANNQSGGGPGGGGILVAGTTTSLAAPQIISNTIINNSVAAGGTGGGISVQYFSSPLIQGNLIRGNVAYNGGGGVNLNTFNSPVVVDNLIVNNSSLVGGHGGGLYISSSDLSQPYFIVNNTIAGNSAFDGTSGIYSIGYVQGVTISNNIVVAAAGQDAVTCDPSFPYTPVFSHNDSYSPTGNPWVGNCNFSSKPNFSSDPAFLSPSNSDFHVAHASPVVGAGDLSAPNLPAVDYDNNPRILDGVIIDIGAYQLVQSAFASATPATLTFASQIVGTTSSPQLVTLPSSGASPFQIGSVQLSGPFAYGSTCPVLAFPGDNTGIPSGSGCAFNVTFVPTTAGPATGRLTINGTNGETLAINLSGAAVDAVSISLTPASLAFPAQLTGTSSAPQTITISNGGSIALAISSLSVSGPFVQTNNCGSSIAPGTSCAVNVTFGPTGGGPVSGTLTLTGTSANTYTASLTGVGLDFSVFVDPVSATVVRGNSASYTVYVSTSVGAPFTTPISLTCIGSPARSTCSFSPSSVTPASGQVTSTMTISTSQANTQVGTYTIIVQGTSGSLSRLYGTQLVVTKK